MPSQIWKFMISGSGWSELRVPQGAQFLSAHVQKGKLAVWAIVIPDNPPCHRRLLVVGTGVNLPPGQVEYLGSVTEQNAELIWHVFIDPHERDSRMQ
jgi:hypothetical protein